MGDADCTYDFREITKFLDQLSKGYDFVIGSRFKGHIQKGAMPFAHRYFGTPITTAIFDFIHGVTYSDIHSGMRAMPTDVFKSILPQESGWQYASEMLAKVRHRKLRSIEVPINFFTAPNNRKSHLKRGGWKTPIREGVGTLVTTFKYAADRVLRFFSVMLVVIGIPLLLISTLDLSNFGFRQPTFGVQITALGLCLIASTTFLLSSLSGSIYGIANHRESREKLRSELDRIFASYILVFLLTSVFGFFYLSVLIDSRWQLPANYFYLSRFIAPVILLNYVIALKTVVVALKLFITEKSEYGHEQQ